MDLNKYACCACEKIPTSNQIFKCDKNHIYCWECATEVDNKCKCRCRLLERPNLLQNDLHLGKQNKDNDNCISCLYKAQECTFVFRSKSKYDEHIVECKYRPYECLLKKLNFTSCKWRDCQHKFEEHYKKGHMKEFGETYTHAQTGSLIFEPNLLACNFLNFKQFRLINAYNKNFALYYEVNRTERFISIIIFLIGTKKDSDKYGYDFTILSPDNVGKMIKIRFSQACFNDNDNIAHIIRDGKCVTLPFFVVKNYVQNNKINFYLKITKI